MDTSIIRDEIDLLTNRASFENDLKIPFAAVATDLETGEEFEFNYRRISNAIAVSMTQSWTCFPFKFKGRYLIAGALWEPVPVMF